MDISLNDNLLIVYTLICLIFWATSFEEEQEPEWEESSQAHSSWQVSLISDAGVVGHSNNQETVCDMTNMLTKMHIIL